MAREYRENLKENGQTAPLHLSDYAINVISALSTGYNGTLSVLDVGCGSGKQMQRIIETIGLDKFSRRVGIDWSARAVNLLNDSDTYDTVVHTQSSRLPFADNEFDIVVSIENLEHLYSEQVIPAIEELKRVANAVVIITPLPRDVINLEWLNAEITLAENDSDAIDNSEFLVLEACVHKSTVYPDSMRDAGFEVSNEVDHGYYFAMSENIDITKIKFAAISQQDMSDNLEDDYRNRYIKLLHQSKNLKI